MPHISIIDIHHPLYQQERELRNKVLLRPIGIPDFGWEMNDAKSWHFITVKEAKVIACALLVSLDEEFKKGQLIQMAVETDYQGIGLGKQLIKTLLDFAKKKGFTEIVIHSRADVTSFYEAMGFIAFGEVFD